MEIGDTVEHSNGPLISTSRHGYDLNSQNSEFRLNDSHIPGSSSAGVSGNAKKSRVDEGEPWLNASLMNSTGESSQLQSSFQPKSSSLMQVKWDGMLEDPAQFEAGSSRTSIDHSRHVSRSGLGFSTRISEMPDLEHTSISYDFFQIEEASSSAQEGPATSNFLSRWALGRSTADEAAHPLPVVALGNSNAGACSGTVVDTGLTLQDAGLAVAAACLPNSHPEESLKLNPVTSTYNDTEHQISLSMHPLEQVNAANNVSEVGNTSGSEDARKQHVSGSSSSTLGESSETGRRCSRKRKISTAPTIAGALSFYSPSVSHGRRDKERIRTTGMGWLDCGSSHSCAPVADASQAVIRGSDEVHQPNESRSHTAIDLLAENNWKPSSFGTDYASSSRVPHYCRAGLLTNENQSSSQISFVRNTSVEPQTWLSSPPEQHREVEANNNNRRESADVQEAGHWSSSSAFSLNGVSPAETRGWETTTNEYLTNNQQRTPSAERLLEIGRRRSITPCISSWPGYAVVESRSGSQSTLASSRRHSNNVMSTESAADETHTLAVANNTLHSPIATSVSAPIFSPMVSSRRRIDPQGRHMLSFSPGSSLLPPISGSVNSESPSDIASSSSSASAFLHRPRLSSFRPSAFLDDQERFVVSPGQSAFRMPLRSLRILSAEGASRHRLVNEILSALVHARRGDDTRFEEMVMLDPLLIFGEAEARDQHRDMRLDVDNMSYEELLALEERIGNVNTGLSEEMLASCLKTSRYSSLEFTLAVGSQESEIKCCICQEDYVEDEELARLSCSHSYHFACVKQWLTLKNQCPICKAAAHPKP